MRLQHVDLYMGILTDSIGIYTLVSGQLETLHSACMPKYKHVLTCQLYQTCLMDRSFKNAGKSPGIVS